MIVEVSFQDTATLRNVDVTGMGTIGQHDSALTVLVRRIAEWEQVLAITRRDSRLVLVDRVEAKLTEEINAVPRSG